MKKLIINFTPTGVIPTKELNPYTPISPEEICKDVEICYGLGVSMVHLHARDGAGKNTMDPQVYADIIGRIRHTCPDIVICASLSGRIFKTLEERSAVLDLEDHLKPDMGSLTLSSLNFFRGESVNSPEMIKNLAIKMKDRGIKPELEAFDPGMINFSKYLIKKGILEPPYYYNLFTGNIFNSQTNFGEISTMVNALPDHSIYSFAGIGDDQLKMNAIGVIAANGVRVGLEDNIFYNLERTVLAKNEELVQRVVNMASSYGREIATPSEVRSLLELPTR